MGSTSTFFTFNTPQRLEFLCKSSFISSPKHTLHLNFSPFIFVNPHITVLTPVHNSLFCSLNHNFSNKTVNFRDISENSSSRFKEDKFVEGKDSGGFSKNSKRSKNFGGSFNFGKRSENGDKGYSFERDSKRVERKMEENVGKIEKTSNVNGNFGGRFNFGKRSENVDKGYSFERDSKRVERKIEENVGKIEKTSNVNGDFGGNFNFGKRSENGDKGHSFERDSNRVQRKMEENMEKIEKTSNVNGDFRKKLNFSEVRGQNGDGFSSRRGEEANSMSVGVNQRIDREVIKGKGDVWRRVERKMEENVRNIERISNVSGDFRKKLKISEFRGQNGDGLSARRGDVANSKSLHIVDRGMIKNDGNCNKVKKKEKLSKKSKPDSPEFHLRVGLDMCSKKGDVMGAISLYDSAVKQGVKMGQYHYTVLLYLCSSASMGVIRPAKSGSGSRSLDTINPQNLDDSDKEEEDDDYDDNDDDGSDSIIDEVKDMKKETQKLEVNEIRVSDDVKKCALEKGFEIYERMSLDKVQMNEASLTSVARMAMAMGNGDMAFDMVNRMKSMGITPKLRSYGPALSVFTSNGDIEKAFLVEKHMLENGVHPEEPELEALLRVSVETGKADRVYYVLHKLRTTARSVSPFIADLIEKWFKSKEASRIGKRKWDHDMIARIMESVGGGWHGKGWFGRGKWSVLRTRIGVDGLCQCCGEKLALIDLDPEETERFAESVGSIAIKREKNASFQKFQRWLDYYGPFEAVVDAANVGLYSQRNFKASKVHAVVNGIRQTLLSRKWPLIVLHNRRVTGGKLDKPIDKDLIERWRNADALYATPTGSNDDWYWLYAAIKFKCLLITNDEMRDHTFQLLGNDFFPKWKERHQVRFSFSEVGPVFHFPPPCSVVIQESGNGHWHIPITSEHQLEEERMWLCVTRPKSLTKNKTHKVEEGSEQGNRGA